MVKTAFEGGVYEKNKVSYKSILFLLVFLFSMSGCSFFDKFEAYYQPIELEGMVSLEGELYYANSQVLLTAVKKASFDDIKKAVEEINGEIVGYISFSNDYQIHLSEKKTFQELQSIISQLANNDLIEDAYINYITSMSYAAVDYRGNSWDNDDDWDENDPSGSNWWAEAIGMPSIWNMELKTETVKVGIFDSMFDTNSKDLQLGFWEYPQKPAIL